MEYLKHITLIVLLCIIAELQTGFAIQCHVCNSRDDPDCLTLPNKNFLTNCSTIKRGARFEGCWKIDQWVDFEVLKQTTPHRVIRQCAEKGDASKPCYYRGGFGSRVNHCYCESDGCNSASSMTLGITAALTVVLVTLRQLHSGL